MLPQLAALAIILLFAATIGPVDAVAVARHVLGAPVPAGAGAEACVAHAARRAPFSVDEAALGRELRRAASAPAVPPEAGREARRLAARAHDLRLRTPLRV